MDSLLYEKSGAAKASRFLSITNNMLKRLIYVYSYNALGGDKYPLEIEAIYNIYDSQDIYGDLFYNLISKRLMETGIVEKKYVLDKHSSLYEDEINKLLEDKELTSIIDENSKDLAVFIFNRYVSKYTLNKGDWMNFMGIVYQASHDKEDHKPSLQEFVDSLEVLVHNVGLSSRNKGSVKKIFLDYFKKIKAETETIVVFPIYVDILDYLNTYHEEVFSDLKWKLFKMRLTKERKTVYNDLRFMRMAYMYIHNLDGVIASAIDNLEKNISLEEIDLMDILNHLSKPNFFKLYSRLGGIEKNLSRIKSMNRIVESKRLEDLVKFIENLLPSKVDDETIKQFVYLRDLAYLELTNYNPSSEKNHTVRRNHRVEYIGASISNNRIILEYNYAGEEIKVPISFKRKGDRLIRINRFKQDKFDDLDWKAKATSVLRSINPRFRIEWQDEE